jgi:hypothetical protein
MSTIKDNDSELRDAGEVWPELEGRLRHNFAQVKGCDCTTSQQARAT